VRLTAGDDGVVGVGPRWSIDVAGAVEVWCCGKPVWAYVPAALLPSLWLPGIAHGESMA
jgi:hypothetical protein